MGGHGPVGGGPKAIPCCAPGSPHLSQTLQAVPAQGESLISLAYNLGLRVFNRHVVHRKQLSGQVRQLQQQYLQYLHLLASDTQVSLGRRGAPAPQPCCPLTALLASQVAQPCLPREYWEMLGGPAPPPEQPWPPVVLLQLGRQLAEVLVQAAQMPRSLAVPQGACRLVPVLYHVYSFRSFRQVGRRRGRGGTPGSVGTAAWRPVLTHHHYLHPRSAS